MQKNITYLLWILIYCLPGRICAQSYLKAGQKRADSLEKIISTSSEDTGKVNVLTILSQQFIDLGNYQKADSTAREALDLCKKLNFSKRKAEAYNKIGLININLSEYSKARTFFFKAIVEDQRIYNTKGIIRRLSNIGITYTMEKKYPLTLHYYTRALQLALVTKNDQSLVICYNNLGLFWADQNRFGKALLYFSNALMKNKNPRDRDSWLASMYFMGLTFEHSGDYIKALQYYLKSLKLAEELGSKSKIMTVTSSIGYVYMNRDNFSKSLEYLYRSLKMAEELRNEREVADLTAAIGKVYLKLNKNDEGIKYILQGFNLMEKTGDQIGLARHMGNIGIVYMQIGDTAKGLDYYLRTIELNKKIDPNADVCSWLNNIGGIFAARAKEQTNKDSSNFYFFKALDYYNQSLSYAKEFGVKREEVISYYLMGLFYYEFNYQQKATEYLKKALKVSYETGEIIFRKDIHQLLSEIYERKGLPGLGLQHYKIYIALRDSIFNSENTERQLRSEINFEFQKKQSIERANQEKINILVIAESKRQKTILWSVVGFMVLILLAALFIYRSYLQKQKINSELKIRNERIEIAHKIIAKKNHEITDSINYALHIQQAMLPDQSEIKNVLPESFIIFKPKDIVSGDFYFFTSCHNKIFIAAADCTGHGVPGGFMSMLGTEKLNTAVKQSSDPGKVLSLLNEGIKLSLHQSEHDYTNRDGMDIVLCAIDLKNRCVEFAGANRPIWIMRKNNDALEEIGGTKASIGGLTENDRYFSTHIIELNKGDTFYLCSDGFADQFGASDKKITTKRFKNLLLTNRGKSLKEQDEILEEFLSDWKGETEQTDDILVVGIRI